MLHTVDNAAASGTAALDEGAAQLRDPAFVRETRQLLRYYLRFFRRHRLLLIGFPLAAAVVALGFGWARPRQYQAVAMLMATGDANESTYLPYLQNSGIADEAIRAFKLDQPPYGLTRAQFLESAFRAETVRNRNLVSVTVTLQDPQAAAAVANHVATAALDLAARTKKTGNAIALRDLLHVRLEEERARLQEATARVDTYRTTAQLDALRTDVHRALTESGQISALSGLIEGARWRLTQLEADVANLSRIDALQRTFDQPVLPAEAASVDEAAKPTNDSRDNDGSRIRLDEVNRVYDTVDQQIVITRRELDALERERDRAVQAARLTPAERGKLAQLYSAERELSRLELERTQREIAFARAFNRYEAARLNVSKYGELIMFDRALPPDRSLARGTVRDALLGGVIGLAVALALVIVRQA